METTQEIASQKTDPKEQTAADDAKSEEKINEEIEELLNNPEKANELEELEKLIASKHKKPTRHIKKLKALYFKLHNPKRLGQLKKYWITPSKKVCSFEQLPHGYMLNCSLCFGSTSSCPFENCGHVFCYKCVEKTWCRCQMSNCKTCGLSPTQIYECNKISCPICLKWTVLPISLEDGKWRNYCSKQCALADLSRMAEKSEARRFAEYEGHARICAMASANSAEWKRLVEIRKNLKIAQLSILELGKSLNKSPDLCGRWINLRLDFEKQLTPEITAYVLTEIGSVETLKDLDSCEVFYKKLLGDLREFEQKLLPFIRGDTQSLVQADTQSDDQKEYQKPG